MTHQIAFLGTGIMGAPMAANLIKAGFQGRGLEPHPLQDRLARRAGRPGRRRPGRLR